MKNTLLGAALVFLAGSLIAADPKDEVTAAARKLGEQANYSWNSTPVIPEGSRLPQNSTEGKTEKDGFTYLKVTIGATVIHTVLKGDKGAVSSPEGGWQSLSEMEAGEGPARRTAMAARNFEPPASEAAKLAMGSKELTKDGDAWSGELTEDSVKAMGASSRSLSGATVSDSKGSVKFWLKDGALSKYETRVSAKITLKGTERAVDRTTIVEIKDVGTTKIEVPEEARKKL